MGRGGVEWMRGKDEEVMPKLFLEMADGRSVKEICVENNWPRPTINLWAHSPKWRTMYLQAREAQGAVQGERVLEAAEKAAEERDYTKIQGLRVLVDALKWSASKHSPRVYGDRVDVTSGGEKLGGVIALPAEQEPVVGVLAKAREVLQSGNRVSRKELSAPEVTAEADDELL